MVGRVCSVAAATVRLVASVIGALLLVHAVFVLFGANPDNVLVEFTRSARDTFGWFAEDLFHTTNPKYGEAINDAIAAVIYVVVGSVVAKAILRLAPAPKAPLRR